MMVSRQLVIKTTLLTAYLVGDCQYNRLHYHQMVGKMFDKAPRHAAVTKVLLYQSNNTPVYSLSEFINLKLINLNV